MDTDCVICFKAHDSNRCPEKKPQHCPECFNFIRRTSDHTQICANKAWYFKPFENVYVKPLVERCIIGCNNAFRFLKDGNWRKTVEGIEMYSLQSDAVMRFKTDLNLSISTTLFTPIRMIVVVKQGDDENETFREKLLLSTSEDQMIIATELDEPFDRIAMKRAHIKTTLILCMAARENMCISVNLLSTANRYEVRYDTAHQKFRIPDALKPLTEEVNYDY